MMEKTKAQIKTEDYSYIYGWGYRPEGSDCGYWMYVKGITYEKEAFEHWSFFKYADVALFDKEPDRFFATYKGIKEVTEVIRDIAWRQEKNPYRFGL